MADPIFARHADVEAWLDPVDDIIKWDISEDYTCSSERISEIIAAIHACRRALAHQLYAEGWSKRQIGLALGVGRRTIQLWLKEEES